MQVCVFAFVIWCVCERDRVYACVCVREREREIEYTIRKKLQFIHSTLNKKREISDGSALCTHF